MVRSMGLWLTWCVRPPAWKINGPPTSQALRSWAKQGSSGKRGSPPWLKLA